MFILHWSLYNLNNLIYNLPIELERIVYFCILYSCLSPRALELRGHAIHWYSGVSLTGENIAQFLADSQKVKIAIILSYYWAKLTMLWKSFTGRKRVYKYWPSVVGNIYLILLNSRSNLVLPKSSLLLFHTWKIAKKTEIHGKTLLFKFFKQCYIIEMQSLLITTFAWVDLNLKHVWRLIIMQAS